MIDQHTRLQMELENLQKQRRDAVAAYVKTGDLNYWREVREVSETIAALSELEETATKGIDGSDQASLMVVDG